MFCSVYQVSCTTWTGDLHWEIAAARGKGILLLRMRAWLYSTGAGRPWRSVGEPPRTTGFSYSLPIR